MLSGVTTPLSLVEFPLSGDWGSFDIGMAAGFMKLSLDTSIAISSVTFKIVKNTKNILIYIYDYEMDIAHNYLQYSHVLSTFL